MPASPGRAGLAWPRGDRGLAVNRSLIAALVSAATLAGCSGSSSPKDSSPPAAPSTTTRSATVARRAAGQSLPSPCALVTQAEASRALGLPLEKASDAVPGTPSRRQCVFNQRGSATARNVVVAVIPNYAHDSSYLLPSVGAVSGIGDSAFLSLDPDDDSGTVTVRVGKNIFQIIVNGYDHRVSGAALERLARSAVSRF
jgi:Protein of unknown function (DUF3558)